MTTRDARASAGPPATPPGRRALVSGASIAGLTTAHWLARTGWQVVVLERAEAFRDGGQNIDVRGAARRVATAMGIEEDLRAHHTTEQGTAFVDARGHRLAAFPADASDSLTAEIEILRGDLARIIRDTLPSTVEFRFGTHPEQVGCQPDRVRVTTSDGLTSEHDLLVVAEGVRSRTRDLVFGADVSSRDLGVNMVYGTIARRDDDDRWWRWYTTDRSRQVTLRPDNVGSMRATLAHLDTQHNIATMDPHQRRAHLRRVFGGAGWQSRRILDGFETTQDAYADRLTQIRMRSWSRGRVVVTGDAAWCVTPIGGGGTSLALLGGHALAAFLSQHPADRTAQAVAAYEAWMRPLVDQAQRLPPGIPRMVYPRSATGAAALRAVVRLAGTAPMRRIATRMGHVAESERELPTVVADLRNP